MASVSSALRFIRDVRAEANRVTWPSWAETRKLTVMVFILAALVALFLTGVDLLIGAGLSTLYGIKF
ncbi:MAG: preprotein translocase subunit SecE [Proteobacteria bacterium]|nr:preprotein translocase subunit SecE [Pseudomonadota bacterium]